MVVSCDSYSHETISIVSMHLENAEFVPSPPLIVFTVFGMVKELVFSETLWSSF